MKNMQNYSYFCIMNLTRVLNCSTQRSTTPPLYTTAIRIYKVKSERPEGFVWSCSIIHIGVTSSYMRQGVPTLEELYKIINKVWKILRFTRILQNLKFREIKGR